jgi:hypothetical protein
MILVAVILGSSNKLKFGALALGEVEEGEIVLGVGVLSQDFFEPKVGVPPHACLQNVGCILVLCNLPREDFTCDVGPDGKGSDAIEFEVTDLV